MLKHRVSSTFQSCSTSLGVYLMHEARLVVILSEKFSPCSYMLKMFCGNKTNTGWRYVSLNFSKYMLAWGDLQLDDMKRNVMPNVYADLCR